MLPLLPPTLRLIALDQRGFGESDHPHSGYTIPGFAADLVALLDALEIDRAVLVGHSYGTFVARQAAIAVPERVAALVLWSDSPTTERLARRASREEASPRGIPPLVRLDQRGVRR